MHRSDAAKPRDGRPQTRSFERFPDRLRGCRLLIAAALAVAAAVPGAATADDESASSAGRAAIVAHRGLFKHAPENTIPAFRACTALGFGFEFDVRRTADGVLVCLHDETLNRTTNGEGVLTDRTFRELRRIDAGRWFDAEFAQTPIPAIEEVLGEIARNARGSQLFAVDLKSADVEADLVAMANRMKVLDRLLFIGRAIERPEVRRALRAADADCHVACLARDVKELEAAVADLDSDWVYLRFVPSAEDVRKADVAGKKVFVAGALFAGKEDKNWAESLAAGVDGILTDHPLELAELIRKTNAATSALQREGTMDQRFERVSTRFIDEYPGLSPVSATTLGDHRHDSRLDEVSPEARRRQAEFLRGVEKELSAIERASLSRDNQVDYQLLSHHIRKELWELETLQEWAWNPVVYTQLTGGAVYGLMARDFAPMAKRLAHVADRLEQFPRLFQQIRSTLEPKRVPSVHAETAIKQNRGVLDTVEQMVRPQLDALSETERARLLRAIETATAAVEEHQKWLETSLLPKAGGDFRLGAELYDRKLAFTLGTTLSRGEIREKAESEIRRVRAEMYELARKVLKNERPAAELPDEPTAETQQSVIAAALEKANADVPPRDGVVETARHSLKLAIDFVRRRQLVSLPDDPLEIIEMPEFQRGVSVAYCDSPGPLEVGLKTFYAVAPLPDDWSDMQCRSFLREYNIRAIHNLTIHEAVPGHYLQIAQSNRSPRRLRALLSSGVFVEGWACYTERLMAEEGFLDNDPLMQLIARKWFLRSTSNAILDQAIHVDGMRREEAMQLMMRDTFQEEREAAGKWVRAQLTSAQLATYFVGVQEHLAMREAARRAWGGEFSLKRYHNGVISFGSPPTRFVQALLLNEPIPEK